MIREYLVKSKEHSQTILASNDVVACRRFLKYLMRCTEERPIELTTAQKLHQGMDREYTWRVEWQKNKFQLWGPR